jgi:hypothetical protein
VVYSLQYESRQQQHIHPSLPGTSTEHALARVEPPSPLPIPPHPITHRPKERGTLSVDTPKASGLSSTRSSMGSSAAEMGVPRDAGEGLAVPVLLPRPLTGSHANLLTRTHR